MNDNVVTMKPKPDTSLDTVHTFANDTFGNVRVIMDGDKPLFCGSDVAKALGYARPRDALHRHCKGAVKRGTLTNGGVQELMFISEGDVYRLIVRSKLPEAERFEHWVFDEVLPSIRKTGGYIDRQDDLSDEDLVAKALIVVNRQLAERNKRIKELEPKASFADAISGSPDSISVGAMAKLLKQNGEETMGRTRFFEWLRRKGYLMVQTCDYNMPTQRSMEGGWFEIKETPIVRPGYDTIISKTPVVTAKGQRYFLARRKRILSEMEEMN